MLKPWQISKWWSDKKYELKADNAGTVVEEYHLKAKVIDSITGELRDPTPAEIAGNVQYWLGKNAHGEDTLDIPFIFQDPNNRVRGDFIPTQPHLLTVRQLNPFCREYFATLSECFLFTSKGNLAKTYTAEFHGEYSLHFLAFILASVSAAFSFHPC
jgi:hypothetical protein